MIISALMGMIGSPLRKWLAIGTVLMALFGYVFWQGYEAAEVKWNAEALQAQLDAMQRDLTIEQNAANQLRRDLATAQTRERTLTERFEQYETELAEGAATPDICLLNPADVERLRGLTH